MINAPKTTSSRRHGGHRAGIGERNRALLNLPGLDWRALIGVFTDAYKKLVFPAFSPLPVACGANQVFAPVQSVRLRTPAIISIVGMFTSSKGPHD